MNLFYPLIISDLRRETDECVSIAFKVPETEIATFEFKQGQYLTLRAHVNGEELRRSYSICSSPLDGELRIAVKQVYEGKFSTFINQQLKRGDVIEAMPPLGRFFTEVKTEHQKQYVFFAAGSGITPILSILKTVLLTEPNSKITLVYGNKNASSVIFKEAIEGLKNRFLQRVQVYHILSRERMDTALFSGRLDEAKIKDLLNDIPSLLQGDEYFICGPEDMTKALQANLKQRNIDESKIHFELFGTSQVYKKRAIAVNAEKKYLMHLQLDGIISEIRLDENEFLLDAALEAGIDLPYACKAGVCCTCRAKLTQGEAEMEVNYALDHDEVNQGFILTCQAVAKTKEIFVNFDIK